MRDSGIRRPTARGEPEFNQNVTQYGLEVSGVPSQGGEPKNNLQTPVFMLGSKQMI